jgi:hypothetical protein
MIQVKMDYTKSSILIVITIMLAGCETYETRLYKDLLQASQTACDRYIAEDSYSKECDTYLQFSTKPPYSTDPIISENRKRYLAQREVNYEREQAIKAAKKIEEYSPEYLSKLNDKDLCLRFYMGVLNEDLTGTRPYELKIKTGTTSFDLNIEGELKNRGLTTEQINKIRNRTINIGSPVCVMYAVYGYPDDENRTVTSHSAITQHVYRTIGLYIYSVDGIIESWQD